MNVVVSEFRAVLHAQANRLRLVRLTLRPVWEFLRESERGTVSSTWLEQWERTTARLVDSLRRSLGEFLSDIGENWEARSLSPSLRDSLQRLERRLNDLEQTGENLSIRSGVLLMEVEESLSELRRTGAKHTKHTLYRELIRHCGNIVQVGRAMDAFHCLNELSDLEMQTRAILDVIEAKGKEEPLSEIAIADVLRSAVNSLRSFAQERGIDTRVTTICEGVVLGRRGELLRAVGNVINNAVKYSYRMKEGTAWVRLSAKQMQRMVNISVESWGVPVLKEEIEDGRIFQYGVRGTYAGLSDVGGYGIGLADAKRIVEGHGGTVSIESKPADHSEFEPDYRKPFITTVTLTLPLER